MKYFHLYTRGLEDGLIFRDREDYVIGMNYVAIAAFKIPVKIMAFVLMSNHFHFVLKARPKDAERFIRLYKQMISKYILSKYSESQFLRRVDTGCDEISIIDDGLRRCVAYVLDNPVKAGLNCVPQGYEWGSGACYFSEIDTLADTISVSEFSTRALRRILRSDVRLDGRFRINRKGYIEPRSYIDVVSVEELYGRPKSFEYFLSTSASSRKTKKDVIVFSDAFIREAIHEILHNKYSIGSSEPVSDDVKMLIARDLRALMNAPSSQIARLLGLSLHKVMKALEI